MSPKLNSVNKQREPMKTTFNYHKSRKAQLNKSVELLAQHQLFFSFTTRRSSCPINLRSCKRSEHMFLGQYNIRLGIAESESFIEEFFLDSNTLPKLLGPLHIRDTPQAS